MDYDPSVSGRLTTISRRIDIEAAQQTLAQSMLARCDRCEDTQLGFQGGGLPARVCWNSNLDFWMAFRAIEKRYWSAFGIGNPFESGSRSIVVEINFPFYGIDRRIGGVLLRGRDGKDYLGHRGLVGGGRRGIGPKAFQEYVGSERFISVTDGDRSSRILYLGPIDTEYLDEAIASFVRLVHRFKSDTTGR